ncbi:MAG TPA: sulfotransferase [Steroidobacteraceae bacterium]|nr:sulfotransferase [Steroidobacteraceae bacterium]
MPTTAADSTASRLEEEALRLLRHGSLRAAADVCRALQTKHPKFASGWRTGSLIALQMGDAAGALALIEKSLALAPADGRSLLQKAHCLRALRRQSEALSVANTVRPAVNGDATALDALGTFYSFCGEQRLALEAYERALQLAPRSAAILFNRATVRRFLGQLAQAEEDYNQVIATRPGDYEAYKNRADLRKQTRERNHVAEMERLLAGGIKDWRGEVQLRHALAKEYEDLGEYARSWAHLEQGARLRRRHLQYDINRDVATVDWIIDAFPRGPDASVAGCPSQEPIFIVGLPRSGTTLVERILGSHSDVYSAGELNDFACALVDAVQSGAARPIPREELVARTAKIDFAALGRNYLERTRPATGRTARFTDKMPLNFLYCGIIRRALPNARIVHLTRHPLAVCYAMYKTLFKDGYPFSYDLEEIGRYYVSYRKLMDHWRATLPGAIHDVSYERLVADQAGETRRLLEFCGLDWQDACLDFTRNPAPTTTASATQVRQPLYDSSLAQWRHYEAQLEELRRQLQAAGVDPDT